MASKKNRSRSRIYKKSSSSSRRRHCKGGRKSRSRNKRSEKKHNKWFQKGCQSGGGSVTGGWPWGPSDVHPQTAGSASSGVPQSINGNHYSLNTATMAPPQSSNHLVERGQFGGTKKKHRRHRRFIGEQRGGMAQYLPEFANSTLSGITRAPAGVMNALQGASTSFTSSDPTIQPIGQPVQLA
jgi:hypothetical protein